jgi:hypothetical protein
MMELLAGFLAPFGGWLALAAAAFGLVKYREFRARKETRDAVQADSDRADRDALARRVESDRRLDRPGVAGGVRTRHTRPE